MTGGVNCSRGEPSKNIAPHSMIVLLKLGRVAMERKCTKLPSPTGTLHSEMFSLELIDVPFTLQVISSLLLC